MLTISKDVFTDDVTALNRFGTEVAFDSIGIGVFKEIFNAFMPTDRITPSNKYHSDERYWDSKHAYRAFLNELVHSLKTRHGFHGLVTCNFSYVAVQELAVACREQGFPYLVIYREGIVQPHRAITEKLPDYKENLFFGPVPADRILTSNAYAAEWIGQMQADYAEEHGQSGTRRSDIVPVGLPRLDIVRADRSRADNPSELLVFGYDPKVSFSYFRELRAPASCEGFRSAVDAIAVRHYRAVTEFSAAHPEVPVCIKTKPTSQVARFIEHALDEAAASLKLDRRPANIRIVENGTPTETLRNTRLAVAVNSTTVIETMLVGARLLTPDFSAAFEPGEAWSFLHDFPRLAEPFHDVSDLERAYFEDWHPDEAYVAERERCLRFFTNGGMGDLASPKITSIIAKCVRGSTSPGRHDEQHGEATIPDG